MSSKAIVVCIFALMLGAATFAAEQHRMRVEIAVDDSGTEVLRFDGVDSDFALHDMQVGESHTITGESGKTAFVVRTEDGFEFDIDGEKNTAIMRGSNECVSS